MNKFYLIFLFPFIFSCTDVPSTLDSVQKIIVSDRNLGTQISTGEKQFGLTIKNGPRQGFQYFDSTKTEYNYRYYTMTITNDSIIPIHLEIYFTQAGLILNDSFKSKVFLLPRHLTPKEQHMDINGISKELKRYLDLEIDKHENLNKTLKPTEKCVLTFGVLTSTKYPDPTTPFETKLLASNEDSPAISFKLKINDTLIIPCGQVSYIEK